MCYQFRARVSLSTNQPGPSTQVAVDGILAIGEHGDYPINAKGQRLYPRRHFWEQIAGVLRRYFIDEGRASVLHSR